MDQDKKRPFYKVVKRFYSIGGQPYLVAFCGGEMTAGTKGERGNIYEKNEFIGSRYRIGNGT